IGAGLIFWGELDVFRHYGQSRCRKALALDGNGFLARLRASAGVVQCDRRWVLSCLDIEVDADYGQPALAVAHEGHVAAAPSDGGGFHTGLMRDSHFEGLPL